MKLTPRHNVFRFCLPMMAAGISIHTHAAELLFSLAPSASHSQLGSGFAPAGDVDGDGIPDVAVADRSGQVASFLGSGIVHLASGVDGSIIRSYEGSPAGSQAFGFSLVALDADGDAIPDLAVGAPGEIVGGAFGAGAIRIYSGASGALLLTATGSAGSQLGVSLANAGDQDGDGRDDFFAGAPLANGSRGEVRLISSATGATLRTFTTTASTSSFGVTLATLGDVDGDGRADVAIGAPGFRITGGNPAGRVILARSSDGATAAEVVGSAVYNRLGESLAPAADANGDGLPDLLIGSYSGGTARLVSGADFSLLADLSLVLPAYRPLTVGGSLDLDNDGVADWLIGSSALTLLNGQPAGGVRVVSGSDFSTLFELAAETPHSGLGLSLQALPGIGFAAGETGRQDPISMGYGFASIWKVETVTDSDGDGVDDEFDTMPNSNMDPTIILAGGDSGVPNRVDENGTSLADVYAELGAVSDYHAPALYLSNATVLNNKLVKNGLINKNESRDILAAVRDALLGKNKNR